MNARIGADDVSDLFLEPQRELLEEVSGLEAAPGGVHVLLEEVGVRSTQRLALSGLDGGVIAGLLPGELKVQANYVYGRETRVYVTVNNQSADDFTFYSSSAKLVANGQSIKSSYSSDYEESASDVASRSRTSGVIVFEKIPRDAALRLILEGSSDNMDVGKYGSLNWTVTWK